MAALIRSGLNQGFVIDMGCSELFDPVSFLKNNLAKKLDKYDGKYIAQAILSHPHSDHITQCEHLGDGSILCPRLLTCPHDKDGEINEKLNWERIKNPEGTGELIKIYKGLYRDRDLPLQTIKFNSKRTIPNLEYGLYYIRSPICGNIHESDDNKYGNSTSILFYFRFEKNSILFPGDMTPEGMKYILDEGRGVEKRFTKFDVNETVKHPDWNERTCDQPSLKSQLRKYGLSILIAPHHGLKDTGFSEELYNSMKGGKPDLVVISERRKKKFTDGITDPQYYGEDTAFGLPVKEENTIQEKRMISTISGRHILIEFKGNIDPRILAYKNPEELLTELN